jgi:hypothetical protein
VKVADAPLKVTAVVPIHSQDDDFCANAPEGVSVLTNGAAPILSLKTVPLFLVPLSLAVCDFFEVAKNIDAANKTVTTTKSSKIQEKCRVIPGRD